jgi:hypothetical protein
LICLCVFNKVRRWFVYAYLIKQDVDLFMCI